MLMFKINFIMQGYWRMSSRRWHNNRLQPEDRSKGQIISALVEKQGFDSQQIADMQQLSRPVAIAAVDMIAGEA